MSTQYQNLTDYNPENVPDASTMRFAITVSEWNPDVTEKLMESAYNTLLKYGAKAENIWVIHVPGSFELIYATKRIVGSIKPDVVIGLGCIVKGDTPHFDYVCSGLTQGFAKLNAEGDIPCVFGLLTTNNIQQALDRSGGKYGNKGEEFAIAAIKMAQLAKTFK
jgi:6,7-dimethyl-8-ribityllumazine synthase